MKVISFLGINKYSQTHYEYKDETFLTEFCSEAVEHFFSPDKMLICLTPTAREGEKAQNWNTLKERMDNKGIAYEVLPIPDGHSEAELWQIFDILTDAVEENEVVLFDITNSFRSLPFLSFMAIAYLKAAKHVNVKGVLYGAWEARDLATNRSPIFDLTPFVSLLDWTTATNRFVDLGDGQPLAGLLKIGMPSGQQMGSDLELRELGKSLRMAAESIETVSLALQVTRPYEVMESSANLANTLKKAMPLISKKARPFAVLAENIQSEYGQFGLAEAYESENLDISLHRQLAMIDWYIQRGQVVQAATLLREWIVSILAYRLNAPVFDLKQGRGPVEKALNNAVESRKDHPRPIEPGKYDEFLSSLPEIEFLRKLWGCVTELRNDIAHVGMRIDPKHAVHLKNKVKSLYPELQKLAEFYLTDVNP